MKITLLADGTSDRALLPAIDWLLRDMNVTGGLVPEFEFADLSRVRPKPSGLAERIGRAVDLYPCDLLLVHRDAEGAPPRARRQEVAAAWEQAGRPSTVTHVPVVPVRMTEAWLLIDEAAIRRASGNPAGRVPLDLPTTSQLDSLPDPKAVLVTLLQEASELAGRKLKKFRPLAKRQDVARFIDSYEPLRRVQGV